MKNSFNLVFLMLIMLACLVFSLPGEAEAQVMKRDLNGITMPFCRSMEADSLTVASTVFQHVTVPSGAVEVTVWATALCAVGGTDSTSVAILPANVPIRMSVADVTTMHVRRTATATATVLYLLWHKL